MHAKTMEGLVGARTNMDLVNTPMRVYKEARYKGDTATMERAMGYACELSDQADDYKAQADEGMKEEAEQAREKAKAECEKAINERKEEQKKFEEKIEERREADTVEVSQEGKKLLKENTDLGNINAPKAEGDIDREPVMYTKAGEVSRTEQAADFSISV
ncbi:MAG: hypothetical protein K2N55_04320 [Lachnospiraceae bacterium]|nr:hypothetical protein [Lachnospiraceae bacterium]